MSEYDMKIVFDKSIAPLLAQIDEICENYHIPYFFSAAVANTAQNTAYENRVRNPAAMKLALHEDQIIKHVEVAAGFQVILPDAKTTVEFIRTKE